MNRTDLEDEKRIVIQGTQNRYQIKKLIGTPKEKEKRKGVSFPADWLDHTFQKIWLTETGTPTPTPTPTPTSSVVWIASWREKSRLTNTKTSRK